MIVFDHYPKSGGSTVRNYLYQCFGRDAVFDVGAAGVKPTPEDFCTMSEQKRRRLQCVMAHAATRLSHALTEADSWVTVVREPVSRAISWYHYARRVPAMIGHGDACQMGLVDFAIRHGLHNHLSMYFGGSVDAMTKRYRLIGSQHDITSFCDRIRRAFSLPVKYTHRRVNAGSYWPADGREIKKLTELCDDDTKFFRAILKSPSFLA